MGRAAESAAESAAAGREVGVACSCCICGCSAGAGEEQREAEESEGGVMKQEDWNGD